MKKSIRAIVAFLVIFSLSGTVYANPSPIQSYSKQLSVNGQAKHVNVVIVDLNNPNIELDVVVANDKIGGSEEFQSMINRKGMAAAINANFFDAYSTLEPYGTIMKDNKVIYLEGENTSLGVKSKNQVYFDRFKTVLKGYLNGKRQNEWNNSTQAMDFYLFDVWYVNNLPLDQTGVYLYTPERGESIQVNGGTSIEVIENKVTKVTKNVQTIYIPRNGYIIYYGSQAASDEYINARFKIGRTVEFGYKTTYTDKGAVEQNKSVEQQNAAKANIPEVPKEPLKLYGCVDKTTKNYWDLKEDKMDFNIFNIWYFNQKPIDSTGVYLYTPERGKSIEVTSGSAIIVQKGKVSNIIYDAKTIEIPVDGYVIYYGKDSADTNYIKERFELGKTVDFYDPNTLVINTDAIIKDAVEKYRAVLYEEIGIFEPSNNMDLSTISDLISAGPYLIKQGNVIVNAEEEGFKEDKITKNRAQRSAIGLTKDNKLVLVTVGNTDMNELSDIMRQLGCIEAMNLDGGASSALYANGKIITTPGRKLNTVLAIYYHSTQQ